MARMPGESWFWHYGIALPLQGRSGHAAVCRNVGRKTARRPLGKDYHQQSRRLAHAAQALRVTVNHSDTPSIHN
jgi:hypothetical protein